MKTVNFENTPGLGNVVKQAKPFCKLTKGMKSISSNYIIGDFNIPIFHGLAGHKFSRLCGFTFESNKTGISHPMFQIVYVPKLKATMKNNDKGLSGWYCWEVVSEYNRDIKSISAMKKIYDFDVTAFFHSDMFEKYIPIFKSNVNYVIDHQIHDLIMSTTDKTELRELKFYVSAIKESMNDISDVQQFVAFTGDGKYNTTSDNPNALANLAYNAHHSYSLKDIDKNNRL